MLELKLLRASTALHRAVLSVALRTLNFKDKIALKKYNKKLTSATQMRFFAIDLLDEAERTEDDANFIYGNRSREITAAYNVIENARDDFGSR